jgi:hypothetical protein
MNQRKLILMGLFAFLAIMLTSCGPFKIDDFYISTGCKGEGTLQIQSTNDNIKTWGTVQLSGNDMRYMAWCDGLVHEWKGTSTLKGYTIVSDPNDPLQFVLDLDEGYYYKKGTGSITTPDGKEIQLP